MSSGSVIHLGSLKILKMWKTPRKLVCEVMVNGCVATCICSDTKTNMTKVLNGLYPYYKFSSFLIKTLSWCWFISRLEQVSDSDDVLFTSSSHAGKICQYPYTQWRKISCVHIILSSAAPLSPTHTHMQSLTIVTHSHFVQCPQGLTQAGDSSLRSHPTKFVLSSF